MVMNISIWTAVWPDMLSWAAAEAMKYSTAARQVRCSVPFALQKEGKSNIGLRSVPGIMIGQANSPRSFHRLHSLDRISCSRIYRCAP